MEYFKESIGAQDINLNDYTMNEIIDVVNDFYARKGENNSTPNDKSNFPQIPKELRSDNEQDNNNDGPGNLNVLSCGQVNENGVEKIV